MKKLLLILFFLISISGCYGNVEETNNTRATQIDTGTELSRIQDFQIKTYGRKLAIQYANSIDECSGLYTYVDRRIACCTDGVPCYIGDEYCKIRFRSDGRTKIIKYGTTCNEMLDVRK